MDREDRDDRESPIAWLEQLDDAIRSADAELDGGGGLERHHDELRALVPSACERAGELATLIADDDPAVRMLVMSTLAAFALAARRPPWFLDALDGVAAACLAELTPTVVRMSAEDPAAEVRDAAVDALIELRDDGHTAAITARIGDPDRHVQSRALAWLAERGDAAAAPVLLARLDADDCDARSIDHVRMIGIDGAGPRLARWLRSDDAAVRSAAARAAVEHVEVASDSLVPDLIAALAAGDLGTLHAAIALARRPTVAAAPALLPWITSRASALHARVDEQLGDVAALAIAAVGDADATAALLARLGVPRTHLGIVCLGLIDRARHPRARDHLHAALAGEPPNLLGIAALLADDRPRMRPLVDRKAPRERRIRYEAALGLTALDLAAVDAATAEVVSRPYDLKVDDLWCGQGIGMALALERIAARVARRTKAWPKPAVAALRGVIVLLDMIDEVLPRSVACYRDRGPLGALVTGLVWFVRDRVLRAGPAIRAAASAID